MAKKQTIKLRNKRGTVVPFAFAHALNLLRLQESRGGSKGWQIDESEKNWKFGNNEIYRDTSSRTGKESEEGE
jgi:hypothetical protein